ncbi:PaaX family transcriptional regulator C-terminal domain-containing protein [Streptomyces pseudovenezuelae]|uniref:Phenylacetic acid degradation operon negative regulatory protein n=1 Tax=Streptomyces pseudovenezuelae TaxID=67350 RepID=A0ABT6LSG1_9ACTN|nr:PaaX family transcriptional regulator C-terminal domain-containing protein [Streptomyces pseudovenezuelae]MDH6219211.1 phenylacetic acid degradation operon negative regulatory protein [Streptomyces pseudovenezuelae]
MRMNVSDRSGEAGLRPLSARSVVLSLLLGTHPPQLAVKDLVRAVEPFGVGGSTLRAALSRMVAAGDLRRTDAVYRLSDRLLARQRRQDEAVHPRTRAWDGDWEMLVITATGREPAERAELRARLTALRLAELREGVWLRPANLNRPLPDDLASVAQSYTARPELPASELAALLWPLDAWSATARSLLAHLAGADRPADRFTAFAAVVRHLLADPVLPPELLPADWPGEPLRAAYAEYQREITGSLGAIECDGAAGAGE